MNASYFASMQATADELFLLHKSDLEEARLSKLYLSDDSIMDSGWDYHWVCSNIAGCIGQLENENEIRDFGCLVHLGGFKYISPEILQRYFPKPEKCPIFIANLYLQQQLLKYCTSFLGETKQA